MLAIILFRFTVRNRVSVNLLIKDAFLDVEAELSINTVSRRDAENL